MPSARPTDSQYVHGTRMDDGTRMARTWHAHGGRMSHLPVPTSQAIATALECARELLAEAAESPHA